MTGQTRKIEGITQQSNPGQSEGRAKHGRGGSVLRNGCVPKKYLRSLRICAKYFLAKAQRAQSGFYIPLSISRRDQRSLISSLAWFMKLKASSGSLVLITVNRVSPSRKTLSGREGSLESSTKRSPLGLDGL